MIPVITSDQMRELEADAVKQGISIEELMSSAAHAIADWLRANVPQARVANPKALGLVGPGNNGGDVLCVLALLSQYGWSVRALLVERSELGDLPVDADLLAQIEVVTEIEDVDESTVILDGIFGNGGRAELSKDVRGITSEVNRTRIETGCSVFAIDLPSGMDTNSGETDQDAVAADVTLCIGYPKVGLTREPGASSAGEIEVIPITGFDGSKIDAPVKMMGRQSARKLIPKRSASAHKTTVGGVLVVGGAPNYYGAPRLVGEAALRSGAGYVGMAVPRSIISAIASSVPELIYHPLSDGDGRRAAEILAKTLRKESSRYNAIVIGPGIGRDKVATAFLDEIFRPEREEIAGEPGENLFGIPRSSSAEDDSHSFDLAERPTVIDADALHWLSQQDNWKDVLVGKSALLTPHAGELAKLSGVEVEEVIADPVQYAVRAAQDSGQIILLKSGFSCVASPEGNVVISQRAMPELATPGTGDVLSGILGAFLAQGLEPFDAAKLALYVGAEGGKRCRWSYGTHPVIARDLIEAIGYAIRDIAMPALWATR